MISYIEQTPNNLIDLDNWREKNSKFSTFLNESEGKLNGLTIFETLLLPITKIQTYNKFLKLILKYFPSTENTNKEYQQFQKGMEYFGSLDEKYKEKKYMMEDVIKLIKLRESIKVEGLVKSNRRLEIEVEIGEHSRSKTRAKNMYLFTDLIVICTFKKNVINKSKKYALSEVSLLDIADVGIFKNAFELTSKGKSKTKFSFNSSNEKTVVLNRIKELQNLEESPTKLFSISTSNLNPITSSPLSNRSDKDKPIPVLEKKFQSTNDLFASTTPSSPVNPNHTLVMGRRRGTNSVIYNTDIYQNNNQDNKAFEKKANSSSDLLNSPQQNTEELPNDSRSKMTQSLQEIPKTSVRSTSISSTPNNSNNNSPQNKTNFFNKFSPKKFFQKNDTTEVPTVEIQPQQVIKVPIKVINPKKPLTKDNPSSLKSPKKNQNTPTKQSPTTIHKTNSPTTIHKTNSPTIQRPNSPLTERKEYICLVCNIKIKGKVISSKGNFYHEECFKCSACKNNLSGVPFSLKENLPICKTCNQNNSESNDSCGTCGKNITGEYLTAINLKYHPDCFVCFNCKSNIKSGYGKRGNKPYCPPCIQEIKKQLQK